MSDPYANAHNPDGTPAYVPPDTDIDPAPVETGRVVVVGDDASPVRVAVAKAARSRPAKREYTEIADVADLLRPRKTGRTLPEGYQYLGRDLPGGNAAKRRLRQMARQQAKEAANG